VTKANIEQKGALCFSEGPFCFLCKNDYLLKLLFFFLSQTSGTNSSSDTSAAPRKIPSCGMYCDYNKFF